VPDVRWHEEDPDALLAVQRQRDDPPPELQALQDLQGRGRHQPHLQHLRRDGACPMKKSKQLKACRRAISRARGDERMYQQAAENAPDDAVRRFNQQRADWAGEKADTYERWAEANR
jgi:hypothetical protein